MTTIDIGIYLHSEPDGLRATIDHLRASTGRPVRTLLLPDGPDIAMRHALTTYRDLPQSATEMPKGAAACFNRLLHFGDATVVVFLEAGALVGPGWLERLLAALDAGPRHGLAGPSTNRAWNMQCAFPGCDEAAISRVAQEAAAQFGNGWQPAEPLYCLADFCYAVRRDVVVAIGGADEGYGAGPCWEMDYTVRAARAGFRAVWAQSSFVYRRPFTRRRQQDETRLFIASKQRYQDKFCGLRLTRERKTYSRHCRGDACAHFAPTEWIRLKAPLIEPPPAEAPPAPNATPRIPATIADPAQAPLVSCIMPTGSRREWVQQSIVYFRRQDFDRAELIIVDDGADQGPDLGDDPRIRYIHSSRKLSIGAKRNLACGQARSDIIVHWDDDDWYAPERLRIQAAPLLEGSADITALGNPPFFDLDRWEFWKCSPELNRRMFVHEVHGGTLAYRRHVVERLARFPDSSLAEDAVFLKAAIARGARLQSIPAGGLFLYLRHGRNAWRFACGHYLDPHGWHRIGEPATLAYDRDFYAGRSRDAASLPRPAAPVALATAAAPPLVSCIMPTHDRRRFVPKAIEYFLRQDYPACELLILDDGDDKVADSVSAETPAVRYISLPERLRLGSKRNAAIEASRGDIIVHWDDDDWMDPTRVSTQVSMLLSSNADICGVSNVWFCEIPSGRLSRYRYPRTQRRWLYGASLCYRRSLWRQKRFEPVDVGEDTRFVWAPPTGHLVDLDEARIMVAMIHDRNTSHPQPFNGPNWQSWDGDTAADLLGDDWRFYEGLHHAPDVSITVEAMT